MSVQHTPTPPELIATLSDALSGEQSRALAVSISRHRGTAVVSRQNDTTEQRVGDTRLLQRAEPTSSEIHDVAGDQYSGWINRSI